MESRPRTGSPGLRKPRPKKSGSAKMRAYRARMRAAGMRQVQIWVPDSASPSFRREVRRQSLLVSRGSTEGEVLREIEALADLDGWR
jgi:hypothetical protein